jgi:hypothetical protein
VSSGFGTTEVDLHYALFQHPRMEPYRLSCVRVEGADGFIFMSIARYRVPNDLGEWDPHNQTVRMSGGDAGRAWRSRVDMRGRWR